MLTLKKKRTQSQCPKVAKAKSEREDSEKVASKTSETAKAAFDKKQPLQNGSKTHLPCRGPFPSKPSQTLRVHVQVFRVLLQGWLTKADESDSQRAGSKESEISLHIDVYLQGCLVLFNVC